MDLNNKRNQTTIRNDQMVLLFNELHFNSITNFDIIDCLYGFNLFSIKIDKKIQVKVNIYFDEIPPEHSKKEYFNDISLEKNLDNISSNILKEFPSLNQFRQALYRTGIYFERQDQEFFEEILKEIINNNVIKGDLPITFAFDTSTYRNHIFTHLYRLYNLKYNRKINNLNFFISDGVFKELKGFEAKYNPSQISRLKKIVEYPYLIDNFGNQNTLYSRILHAAHVDFLKTIKFVNAKWVETEKEGNDDDSQIIMKLANEAATQNVKLYLFTHDSDFECRADGYRNVHCKFLEYPYYKIIGNQFSIDWYYLARIFYELAILFGAIIIKVPNGNNIFIFGIWRGKRTEDWENERVKYLHLIQLYLKLNNNSNYLIR